MGLRESINYFKYYIKLTDANKIARRYFIMNSFDGIVTILGVISGALASGLVDPGVVFGIGLSAAIAMGLSGIAGTFMAEKAERDLELDRLEKSVLMDLSNSVHGKAIRVTIIYVSVINALSIIVASLVAMMPLLLGMMNIVDPLTSIYSSIVVAFIYLFVLGSRLGSLTGKNIIIEGLKMVIIGIITAAIILYVLS